MPTIKVRKAHREEIAGAQILKQAVERDSGLSDPGNLRLDLDAGLDPELVHLQAHDPDGFFSALDRDETLGFGAAHVRSRQWILSELWVLTQHQGRGAGRALLSRLLGYGERSGARERLALVPALPSIQALLLASGMKTICPVHRLGMAADEAARIAAALGRTLPAQDVTRELLKRRGQADLDRIDRVVRGIVREIDHVHWIKDRGLNLAFVRQRDRIAAYGYGGPGQAGPVAGSTREAALAALGQALELAVASGTRRPTVFVPEPFAEALDALTDGGARIEATWLLYGDGVQLQADR